MSANKNPADDFGRDLTKNNNKSTKKEVTEDEVDKLLSKEDGLIERSRDTKLFVTYSIYCIMNFHFYRVLFNTNFFLFVFHFLENFRCRHVANGRCVHCSPLEPYDETYLKDHNIKHLSFHSYIRKQTSGIDRGKYMIFEDINCRIKTGCRDHLPWPKGICSKCQPSAITLNRQIYRHVDNVMFENTSIVERFLNYWRTTGHQRVGYLYGTYEVNTDVPLGIRARVAAIYEPPQETSRDSIHLLPEPEDGVNDIEEFAAALGLKKV